MPPPAADAPPMPSPSPGMARAVAAPPKRPAACGPPDPAHAGREAGLRRADDLPVNVESAGSRTPSP